MLRHDDPHDEPSAGPLDPGERLVGGPWRLIVWGPGRSLAGGPLLLTDQALRFTPAWAGLDAVRPASGPPSAPPLRAPRASIARVAWEHSLFFLRNLRMEFLDIAPIHVLGGKEELRQLAEALGVRS
jgi:hypothetical protein